jgi:hypothetical protein
MRANRPALLLVTGSALVDIEPVGEPDAVVERARALRVEWKASTP